MYLIDGFLASVARHPRRAALEVGGSTVTYEELALRAAAIAERVRGEASLVALLAHRSLSAYAGALGILLAGKGYVALHPGFPLERTSHMLTQSGATTVVVGSESRGLLSDLQAAVDRPLTMVAAEELAPAREVPTPPKITDDSLAYLMFTSGSTGTPRGIPVTHGNVAAYMDHVYRLYAPTCEDRVSQAFDLTWDLSVHDMFLAWWGGGCLCSVPPHAIMAPIHFIREQKLTFWFSVPTVISVCARMGLLRPDLLPSLRWSLFCGEALAAASAALWQAAAPNSHVENLYGPIETTIAVTRYRWTPEAPCRNGVVPIGYPFHGHRARLDDGELSIAGPQVAVGYWKNPEATAARFVREGDTVWYRTGDCVQMDADGCLHFLGRNDSQIKLRGVRVELQEIDHALRRASGTDLAVAVAWPLEMGRADAVYGFVAGPEHADEDLILQRCASLLPRSMVPRRVFVLSDMPLNPNGKIDRRQLVEHLREALSQN